MLESIECMCYKKLLLLAVLMMVNVSSTYLFHREGGHADVLMALICKFSMNKLSTIGLFGEPIAAPSICS